MSLLAASCATPASPVEPSREPDQGALRLAVVDTRHDFTRELAKFTTRYRETWVRSPDGWLLARAEELP